jgi:2,3-bisphosphoglycerate-dependent phosphoglycerate mutase
MKLHNLEFDEVHASVLKRAVRTAWTALHSCNQHFIPVKHTWRLNERHYGALTGLSKKEAAAQLGEEMLLKYRRGFDAEPLSMSENHPLWTGNDRRYADLGPLMPRGESLKQCLDRILPYWYESVVPSIRAGKNVMVAAHNNVIRCLCMHLDGIAPDDLRLLEIPTGTPMVLALDPVTLRPVGTKDAIGFSGTFLTDESAGVAKVEVKVEVSEALARAEAKAANARAHAAGVAASVAALDAALKRSGKVEYNLDEVISTMRLCDVVSPEVVRAEAAKLGLAKCQVRESFTEGSYNDAKRAQMR